MSPVFEFVSCPTCDGNNWENEGIFKNTEREGIQAECNDCGCRFEMIVTARTLVKKGTDEP